MAIFTGIYQRKAGLLIANNGNVTTMTASSSPTDFSTSATTAGSSRTSQFDAGLADLPSWAELVSEHADSVYRLAYRLCGNQQDAEDLTQDTFMRVFRSLKNYKPGTFEGWLHRITTNLFLDMVRRRSIIRMEALPEEYDRIESHRPADTYPEIAYEMNNLDPALSAALDSLAPDFRVALVLCDGLGMSYDDIGRTLGIKMGTVRSRIHRARAQLRAQLAQTEEGYLSFIGDGRANMAQTGQ